MVDVVRSTPESGQRAVPRRVVVVGGGITGLAAAHRLHELAPETEVRLLEGASRVGGVLETQRIGDYLLERCADMFTTGEPDALRLCERIGYAPQLITPRPGERRAFIVRGRRLFPVPEGFALLRPTRALPVLLSGLLSWPGRLRLLGERWVRPRTEADDESLADFARRRLGVEAYERLIQPLIGGIYTADPERLSMRAALAQFVEMERRHGSLIRASLRTRGAAERSASGARYDQFVTPREGMGHLVDTLAARLPEGTIRTDTRVVAVTPRSEGGWRVVAESGEHWDAEGVIVALPAPRAAAALEDADPQLAAALRGIEYAGCSVVALGYRRDQLRRLPAGFGLIVPLVERRRVLAVSFTSAKYEGRAPEDRLLLRVFVGGACQPELNDLPDEELKALVFDELRELIGAEGAPDLCAIIRWREVMPQYHVGHLERVAEIERLAARHPGLELAGNAYRGVGIPFCVRSGEAAAARILGRETSQAVTDGAASGA